MPMNYLIGMWIAVGAIIAGIFVWAIAAEIVGKHQRHAPATTFRHDHLVVTEPRRSVEPLVGAAR
jgi:hypothetical protein